MEFDPPGTIGSFVAGMNDKGVIAGDFGTGTSAGGYIRSADGNFTEFSVRGTSTTGPVGINNAGVVVGYFENGNGIDVGFIRTPSHADEIAGDGHPVPADESMRSLDCEGE
jgi:hypothetical protein